VCDLETSRMRRPRPALSRRATAKTKLYTVYCMPTFGPSLYEKLMQEVLHVRLFNYFVPFNCRLYFTVVLSDCDVVTNLSNICTQPKSSNRKVQSANPIYCL